MNLQRILQLFFRYLIFIGIPYFIAKKIEKYFWAHANEDLKRKINKRLVEKDKIDKLSNSTQNALDNQGGAFDLITVWLTKLVVVDFALKAALGGGIAASIESESADNAATAIAQYGQAIIMAPGNKFKKIINKPRRIDPKSTRNIREILLDKNLGNKEKRELLKLKINYTLKNLTGRKRTQFILAGIV